MNSLAQTPLHPYPLPDAIRRNVRPLKYGRRNGVDAKDGRVFQIDGWPKWKIERQLAWLAIYTDEVAKDPKIAEIACEILNQAQVGERECARQWAALLAWVQKEVRYVNELAERIQSPQYTLDKRHGDCDCKAILLRALGASLRLPSCWVVSGRFKATGERVRWIHQPGEKAPRGVAWTHIYLLAGWPPFRARYWAFAEPTLSVPFGWDAKDGDPALLPRQREDLVGTATRTHFGSATSAPTASTAACTAAASDERKWYKKIVWTQIVANTLPLFLSGIAIQLAISAVRKKAA